MRHWLLVFSSSSCCGLFLVLFGCGGATTGGGGGSEGNGGGGGGSSSASSGGSSGSSGQDADSGQPQTGGEAGSPPSVGVSVQSACPGVTACGGDPTGAWDYASGCAQIDLGRVTRACPGASISGLEATVAGTVTFGAGTVTRSFDARYSAVLGVPSECAAPVGGCSAVEADLAASFDSASCSATAAGGCSCNVAGHVQDTGTTTYTVDGDQVVTGDGNRYDFCVQGGTMSYTHTDGPSPETGSFQLSKG